MPLSEILDDAYATITQLEPGDEEEYLAHLYRLSGLIHLHLSGLVQASDVVPNPELEWQEMELSIGTLTKQTPDSRLDAARVQMYIPITGSEWASRLGECLNRCEREEAAMVRLYRGYKEDGDLVEHMASVNYTGRFDSICKSSADIETTTDLTSRLVKREIIQNDIKVDDKMQKYVHALLGMIQAIRFATEWAQLDKASKGRYRETMFEIIVPDRDQTFYKKFSNRHEKIVKARKDLKALYEKFGVSVLLDGFWNPVIDYSDGKTGRTISFTATVKLMLQNPPQSGHRYFAENRRMLRSLMEVIGDPVKSYVFKFIDMSK